MDRILAVVMVVEVLRHFPLKVRRPFIEHIHQHVKPLRTRDCSFSWNSWWSWGVQQWMVKHVSDEELERLSTRDEFAWPGATSSIESPPVGSHLFPQPAGLVQQALVDPDRSGGRHLHWLLQDRLEFLTSPGLAISGCLVEEHVHDLFAAHCRREGSQRSPLRNATNKQTSSKNGGRKKAIRTQAMSPDRLNRAAYPPRRSCLLTPKLGFERRRNRLLWT